MTTKPFSWRPVGAYVVARLDATDAPAVLAHLLALDPADRSLRFGAAFDDASVARYVASIDFDDAAVFGARADGVLAGVAHLALADGIAELGVSIDAAHRRRGVASALASAALAEAERRAAHELRLHCAANNLGMRRIAQQLDMELHAEGADLVARRRLERGAALNAEALAA